MTADRRARLDELIQLFRESGRGWTTRELALRFHVSERQMRRDLADIMSDPDYAPLVAEVRCEYRMMEMCH